MKKIIISVSMLLFLLIGCANDSSSDQANLSLTVGYYGEDVGATNDLIREVEMEFRRLYPEIELVIDREPYNLDGGKNYFTKLATQIMSGKGPDVFWVEYSYMDIDKMMKAGSFVNLSSYLEDDELFNGITYNENVLKGGQYDNKQYIIPLSYSIPILLSERDMLKEKNIDTSLYTNYFSIWESIEHYSELYMNNPKLPFPVHLLYQQVDFPYYSGINWYSFNLESANLHLPELEQAFTLYRSINRSTKYCDETNMGFGEFYGANRIKQKQELFELYCGYGSYVDLFSNVMAVKSFGEPVIAPIYNVNGKITARIEDAVAVRANSPNAQNAYHFIQLLLSEKFQGLHNSLGPLNIPLSNTALSKSLEQYKEKLNPNNQYAFSGLGDINDLMPVSNTVIEQFKEATFSVENSYIPNEYLRNELYSGFMPFFKYEKPFSDCISEAEEDIKLYLSE